MIQEFKNIAPYLPYNLNVLYGEKTVWELVTHYTNKDFQVDLKTALYLKVKPLLLPLSELLSINSDTGKPYFIDVVGAACPLPFMGRNNKFWKPIMAGNKETGFSIDIDNAYNDHSFGIDMENGDLACYLNDELHTTNNQVAYIDALCKYHFDFRNLIDKGLAVNKLDYIK